jgi:hypothetical protein
MPTTTPAVKQEAKPNIFQRLGKGIQKVFGGGGPERSEVGKIFLGEQEKHGQVPLYSPEQIALINALGPQGLQWLMQQENFEPLQQALSDLMSKNLQQPNEEAFAPYRSQFDQLLGRNLQQPNEEALAPYMQELQNQLGYNRENRFNFEPIAARARQQFGEQTLPSIFERFTSMGKGAQTTGAFQGSLERGGAELNRGLAALESEYALKNRPLDLQQQQLLQSLLGQQQGYGLGKAQVGNQQQDLLQRLLGQEQGYGIQKAQLGNQQQQLLQSLLGQQQGYGLQKQGLGLDVLGQGLRQQFNPYYQPSTPGALQKGLQGALKAGGAVIGASLV